MTTRLQGFEAQQDAAGVISNSKINSNPENTVGVLSMAGKGVELLVSPTEDSGKILACFGQVRPEGKLILALVCKSLNLL